MKARLIIPYVFIFLLVSGLAFSWVENETLGRNVTFDTGVGTTLYNFTGVFGLDTASLISAGKMSSNCGDLKIYLDGELIPFYIESCGSTNSGVWVLFDSIGGDPVALEIYYNNTALNLSNASAVFSPSFASVYLGDSFNDLLGVNNLATTGGNVSILDNSSCHYGKCYAIKDSGAYMYKNTPSGIPLTNAVGSIFARAKLPTNASGGFDIFGYGQSASNYRTRDLRCNVFSSGSCGFTIYGNPTNPTTPYIDNSQNNLYIGSVTKADWGEICINGLCSMSGFGASADTGTTRLAFGAHTDLTASTRIGQAGLPAFLDSMMVSKSGYNFSVNFKQAYSYQTYNVSSELTPPLPPVPPNTPAFSNTPPAKIPQNNSFVMSWGAVDFATLYNISLDNVRKLAETNATTYNYTASDPLGSYRFGLSASGSGGVSNVSYSGYFEICEINFGCVDFVCLSTNVSSCVSVVDSGCDYEFTGNLSDYDGVCSYHVVDTNNWLDFDLSQQSNVLLYGIFIFFWLGMILISFMFRNPYTAGIMMFIGIGLGFMSLWISPVLTIMFMLFSTLLFMYFAK